MALLSENTIGIDCPIWLMDLETGLKSLFKTTSSTDSPIGPADLSLTTQLPSF
ncbi:MAG: hypothetical protein IPN49_11280 [Saprospiraceae bacterium]|nr:hypothetical protein [Saprospiraceae bacterium]